MDSKEFEISRLKSLLIDVEGKQVPSRSLPIAMKVGLIIPAASLALFIYMAGFSNNSIYISIFAFLFGAAFQMFITYKRNLNILDFVIKFVSKEKVEARLAELSDS